MPTTRDLDAELDERLQRYAASGMSRAGMLAQLNLAGYPTDKLRERFPEMSAVAFGITTPTSDPGQQGRAATSSNQTPLAEPAAQSRGSEDGYAVEVRRTVRLACSSRLPRRAKWQQPRATLQQRRRAAASPSTTCR